jgi:hypothetical protein
MNISHSAPPRLTIKSVKASLAPLGIVLRKTCEGEFCVRLKGSPPDHGYFTTQLDDALATGRWMASAFKLEGGAYVRA